MGEFHLLKEVDRAEEHAIFFHGLGARYDTTWAVRGETGELWPKWFADDLEGVAVRAASYEAAKSKWRGAAMHLPDRALHLLALILAEPAFSTGTFTLVGHSLGGLVIKSILRLAADSAPQDVGMASFVQRVRRVAFIATPHAGSALAGQANDWKFLFRPTVATAGLAANDPHLRELNRWYAGWSQRQNIAHLVLREDRPLGIWGMVVAPDSAELPGSSAIPIDADHLSITRISGRSDPQYSLLMDLIRRRERPNPPTPANEKNGEDASRRRANIVKLEMWLGPKSSLSPEDRLNQAISEFHRLADEADQGDAESAELATNLAPWAREAARDYYASSEPFHRIERVLLTRLAEFPSVSGGGRRVAPSDPDEIERGLWELHFNPHSANARKAIAFLPSGTVGEGGNENEATWELSGTTLRILRANGSLQNEFIFIPTSKYFACTDSPEAIGIKGQTIRRR